MYIFRHWLLNLLVLALSALAPRGAQPVAASIKIAMMEVLSDSNTRGMERPA